MIGEVSRQNTTKHLGVGVINNKFKKARFLVSDHPFLNPLYQHILSIYR